MVTQEYGFRNPLVEEGVEFAPAAARLRSWFMKRNPLSNTCVGSISATAVDAAAESSSSDDEDDEDEEE
jgi:hypothetical protein